MKNTMQLAIKYPHALFVNLIYIVQENDWGLGKTLMKPVSIKVLWDNNSVPKCPLYFDKLNFFYCTRFVHVKYPPTHQILDLSFNLLAKL